MGRSDLIKRIIGYLPLGYLPNYFQGPVRDIPRYCPRYFRVLSALDILIPLPNYFFQDFAQLFQGFAQLFQGFAQLFQGFAQLFFLKYNWAKPNYFMILPNYFRIFPNYFKNFPNYIKCLPIVMFTNGFIN